MNRELENTLVATYPAIYRSLKPRYSGACRFECDDGWYRLIEELSRKLEAKARTTGLLAVEVGEKLGSLRVLFRGDVTSAVDGWLAEAARQSRRTCERCSQPAMLRRRKEGRVRTLCPTCAATMDYVLE
jgi:hypothetical protein